MYEEKVKDRKGKKREDGKRQKGIFSDEVQGSRQFAGAGTHETSLEMCLKGRTIKKKEFSGKRGTKIWV
jgi:hypothetical protein